MSVVILVGGSVSAIAKPVVSFDKETHDYGRVLYGDVVKEEFTLTNLGNENLVIEKLESSCGCTKAVHGNSVVPPKGHTKIVASFDTDGLRPGKKQKTVTVFTNDGEKPETKLTLTADVARELYAEPMNLALSLDEYKENVAFALKVTNESDRPLKLESITCECATPPVMDPSEATIQPHTSLPLELKLQLKKDPGREFYNGKFLIRTTHPREKVIEIRYLIKLRKPV
jgi:hypothetical protein